MNLHLTNYNEVIQLYEDIYYVFKQSKYVVMLYNICKMAEQLYIIYRTFGELCVYLSLATFVSGLWITKL